MRFKYIAKALAFIIVFALLFNVIEKKYELFSRDGHAIQKSKAGWYNFSSNADIYIMGSSRAVRGFQFSEINGLKAFNYGRAGSNPKYHYQLYVDFIKPNWKKKPKYIIYEIDWFSFDERSLKNNIEIDFSYMPNHIFINYLIKNPNEIDKSIVNRFYTFKANQKDFSHLKYLFSTNNKYSSDSNKKQTDNIVNAKLGDSGLIDDVQLYYLLKLISAIKQDGIKLIFVQIPEFRPLKNSAQINHNNSFITYIANLYNVDFINYNKSLNYINYNKDYYVDFTHLNNNGLKEFSKYLVNDLAHHISN